ncbi:DUF2147 domain-containing protein [Dokdonia sp. Hel_I_53]|uniref:DUF2147 domain-containing protein n=1 Tax=Dokdonia sp. Hel_I_53 TaxID=1566287 RepID=UPI00119BF74B|nr:DUF2147 domain-containing protein [Dokdonia sp. Hel_I_53]TVZ51504.1 uncharacterized protein (DUF2147 family) [Dokdonia sp. Hel_I_53]
MKRTILILGMLLLAISLQAQRGTIYGKWTTIDDETGQAKSTVDIYQKNGKVFGKIVEITNPVKRKMICDLCQGEEKGEPVLGLDIIKNLQKDGRYYEGGTIFDPVKGKEYRAKIWLDPKDPGVLNVRGYVAFLYRTQEWIRLD